MPRYELLLPGGGPAVPLLDAPITVGRAPGNAVVLGDDSVSWHHAQLWSEAGFAWVRDLGSRNGTFVNGDRVVASARLARGDKLRIGARAELVLQASGDLPAVLRTRHVEDLSTGVRVLVRTDRFRLGSGPDCDLRIAGWPARAATLVLHADGEVWVGTDDGEWPLEVGVAFEVRDRRFRLVEDAVDHEPTVDIGVQRYPYRLVADANAAGGPAATLVDPGTGRELALTGNRGVLLVVLARQLAKDREEGKGEADQGWCGTDDAMIGVWGRGHKDANHLNVLVHRLRGALQAEGFDPWFIEKRRGAIRVRVGEVELP
ncbi:MAG: FHA domain-containing protein [Myxococcota bacterium]